MRVMFMIRSGHQGPPTPELMAAMGQLIEREVKAGRLVDTAGLMPPAMGAEVQVRDGKVVVIDGPFVEAREVVGGYAVFDFANKQEALAAATEFMAMHVAHMPGWEGTCDMRLVAGD